MRVSETAVAAMLEISLSITRRRFAYSIGTRIAFMAATLAYSRELHGGILMNWFKAERRWIFAGLVLVVACCLPASAQQRREYITLPADAVHAVAAEHSMVVAQEKIGARIGADILRRGSNVLEAPRAAGFSLGGNHPRPGGNRDSAVPRTHPH